MSIKQFWQIFSLASTVLTATVFTSVESGRAQSAKFICQPDTQSVPTTYANTPEGPKPFIKWTSNHFTQSTFTPMKRCQSVTERLNQFDAEDKLDYIVTGWVNGQPVFCATQTCSEDTVLLTLKPDQEPNQALEEMKATRAGTSGPTYQSSGNDAPVVLNVNEYLAESAVEQPAGAASSTPAPNTTSTEATPGEPEPSGKPLF